MKRLAALGLIASALSLAGACHFETSFQLHAQVDPGGPGEQFRDACHEQATARCSYDARCQPHAFALEWADSAQCDERETLVCQLAATDPSSTYDDASIRSCALPADMPCPSDPGYDSALDAFRDACQRPPGKLPDGGACAHDSACTSGNCEGYATSQEGCAACAPMPCGGACAAGELCTFSALGSTCVLLGSVGDACTTFSECVTFRCEDGVCAAAPDIGEACDLTNACDASEAYCDPMTKTCRLIGVAQANEPCGLLPSGLTSCTGGSTCPSYTSASTCIPPAEDGAFCDPSQSLFCLFPAMCIDGYCQFHAPLCAAPG